MIFVTGDTHGDFSRFKDEKFTKLGLSENDYVIICGDFGGVWSGADDKEGLDFLESLSCMILFVDGNHENHDMLDSMPVSEWNGGKVHFIRKNIVHLMRGQIFTLEEKNFFVMGGAASHDIKHGIIDSEDPYYLDDFMNQISIGRQVRIKGITWWEQELPDAEQLKEGLDSLENRDNKVDFVLTHCAPTEIQNAISEKMEDTSYEATYLTDYFQCIYEMCEFEKWYCGHYHCNDKYDKLTVLYEKIIKIC